MTMAEPLLPHPRHGADRTAAAEPGPGGPPPLAPEEPDVLPDQEHGADEPRPQLPTDIPFRTPTPGEKLHPEDLADETGG